MANPGAPPRSFLRLRGKSFMSVVLTPELPAERWLGQLDDQVGRSPKVFEGRPVLLDVSLLRGAAAEIAPLVQALAGRGIHVVGLDGTIPPGVEALGAALPPVIAGGRAASLAGVPEPVVAAAAAPPEPARTAEPSALVLDQPVRSGQSVTHLAGDVTVVGSVASGSEVIAGGSIHVYGTLRGRAIAGMGGGTGGTRPRIFCTRLMAELLAIDGVYKTADEIPAALQGRAVQAWLDGEELMVAGLE